MGSWMGREGETPGSPQALGLGTEPQGFRKGKRTAGSDLPEWDRAQLVPPPTPPHPRRPVLTAPDECFPQMKQFKTKQMPKTTPG